MVKKLMDSTEREKIRWKYDAGVQRHKHHWNRPYAGIVFDGKEPVGKCPNNMTQELAEELLNEGIPWYDPKRPLICSQTQLPYPQAIYNVYEGVVYKAIPTQVGCSYHGFPVIKKIPEEIKEQLYQLAEQKGCKRELTKWLKDK
jgi:hypothetical protein